MSRNKNMYYNFDMIIPRLIDSFEHIDWESVNYILRNINKPCICIGTGGSNSVSLFFSIILEEENKIIAIAKEPRDLLYMNYFRNYMYLLAITYGNKNHGIDKAIQRARENKLSVHVITTNSDSKSDICYKGKTPRERSFISLASTIIPMSILLNYYLKYDNKELLTLIKDVYLNANKMNVEFKFKAVLPLFEIITGDNTNVASKVLESTIVEAGLGIPIIHEKYSYCHGRSTLSYFSRNSNLIYLINGKQSNLDNMLLNNIKGLYSNIIILNSKYTDRIIGEFDLAIQSLILCRFIAEKQGKDLSKVEYAPIVRKLYGYHGKI